VTNDDYLDTVTVISTSDYGSGFSSYEKKNEEGISMLDKTNFWDRQYRKWKIDCYRELLDKGYRPGEWEISECGSIYFASNPFINARNVVTPWKESIHYVE
jgi:hypothetical protein